MDYAFPAAKFTLPGDPGKVRETAGAYGRFATAAGEGAGGLRGLQVTSWVGSEGDIYRQGVAKLPPDLDKAHDAYSRVASALNGFAEVLDREQRQIGVIRTYAESDWRALEEARSQRSNLKEPTDEQKEGNPNAQSDYDEAKGGLDRRIGYLEGQWKLRVDAATGARGRVDEAARAAGNQIRTAGNISPTANQNWFQDRWEKTKRAVGDAIDGLKNFLKEHASFFRGLAKVLRVVGYALMVVGALTSVFFGVGGGLMLIGGALVAAGDILDKSVDWAEGKISGWDLLKSAGISILVNVGLGAAGKLAMPLVARVAAPLMARAAPLMAKAAPVMGRMAKLGDTLKIKPVLGAVDDFVDSAMSRVVPGWMRAVNEVAFPGRSRTAPATTGPGMTSLADDAGSPNLNLGPGAMHADDGPGLTHTGDGPGVTQANAGPAANHANDGPGTTQANDGPPASHADDGGHHDAGDGDRPDDTPFEPDAEYPGTADQTFQDVDHYHAGPYQPGEAPPLGSRPDLYEGARDFPDKASADEWGTQVWGERARELSGDLRNAGTRYFGTESAAYRLNRVLRGQEPNLPREIVEDYENLAGQLDEFLASNPVPEDVVVYRSLGADAFPEGLDNITGLTRTEPGFMSTALGKVHYSSMGVVMKLRVPAGTPGMYVRPVSSPVYFNEQEMLLGRGLQYRVANVQELPDGRYLVEAEILPPTPTG